ncbi:RsmB/NOP family class I SAM-dependent RNA methyltransferase [Novispirillum sp. DQ9]|uniref:RsmB/NOP family class I SAM-dependent RNA methyltransferase n=1 Tax=Novispirillum sp. DQ9 TaxID=3398612 RepID=UPI003C7E9A36
MTALPANRTAALEVFQAVLRDQRPLEDQVELRTRSLDPRDRAFVRLVVATTLRRLGQIDRVLDRALDRPMPRKLAPVKDILRLGAAQLLFLDTPAHAVVDTAVQLTKAGRFLPYAGMVNAVLRRLSREGKELAAAVDAARLNTPRWLWQDWVTTYGEDTARAIGAAHLTEAPLDITLRPGEDAAAWAERLDAVVLPTGSLRRAAGGGIAGLPGFDEGTWWVQDAAAALPARLLGDVAGKRVADLCAAPGGKTLQLAAAGAEVLAVDRSARRLRRVTENLARLRLTAEIVDADAVTWRPDAPVDAVLLDAPCSATGTIRRHPDVPRHKTPADIETLAATQGALLRAAADMVVPGGLVVYCVCSLQAAEGPAQVAAALDLGLPFEIVPVTADEVGGLAELLAPDGGLRTLPCHLPGQGGLDGFYAARLRRL